MANGTGYITQVVGPVVDVHFDQGDLELPRIHEALKIKRENGRTLVVEVSITPFFFKISTPRTPRRLTPRSS